jgi:hypothetical protein
MQKNFGKNQNRFLTFLGLAVLASLTKVPAGLGLKPLIIARVRFVTLRAC